jgi:signal transduction histidine kinase
LTRSYFSLNSIALSGLALLAGMFVFLLWHVGLLVSLQDTLVSRSIRFDSFVGPKLWLAALSMMAASLFAGNAVARLGLRLAFPFLGGGFVALVALSWIAAKFFDITILVVPIVLAGLAASVLVHFSRLFEVDRELTRTINFAAGQIDSSEDEQKRSRLMSGLKLLDTVLSLTEALVFQHDENQVLVPAVRFRTSTSGSLESNRNSTWRAGINLCERAMQTGELLILKSENGNQATTAALPLRHEGRTVGALLIRLRGDFNEDDRALLSAVGAQIARDLQREETYRHTQKWRLCSSLSIEAAQQRLESLYVLSGLITEQRFGAQVLSESSDGLAVSYLDGRLAYCNAAFLQVAQLSEDDVRKLDLFGVLDRFRTELFDEPVLAVRRVLQSGETYERELHFADRDQTFALRISVIADDAPTNHNPRQPLCLAIVVRDLSRTKEYEQLKSDMISLMSHELRTPLTSINGFAELLTAEEKIPEQAKEFVTIIAQEAQRMSRMINSFLAVTQLQRKDKQEVLKIPLKLNDVVRETLMNLQPTAKKKRIRLVEQPAERIPLVAADKSLITQAVRNLVSNAIKYSPERTTVTVSTMLEAETVRVSVEDRGYGVPPEAIDRVWEKFYRVVREGQHKDEESTGLGLSFVREVVEQHGGRVELESEIGRGSKFSFTLPRL